MRESISDNHGDKLRITEIFFSLQGESRSAGFPTVFVRLTGCPLRCGYCDTEYAFSGGEWMSVESILDDVSKYNAQYVTVTGGEPLAQKNCIKLLQRLCDEKFKVSLETSGAIDISHVDARVVKVMDFKTPGSGEQSRNLEGNIRFLTAADQVKFVICDRVDYQWAKEQLIKIHSQSLCEVLFSPSYGQMDGKQLAEWIIADQLPVRFQLQLHKILWGEQPGR